MGIFKFFCVRSAGRRGEGIEITKGSNGHGRVHDHPSFTSLLKQKQR